MDVKLVLDEIDDLTSIECSLQTIQSFAFIAGYGVDKYMKRTQPCHVCIDLLTIDKDFNFDDDSQPEFRLLQLTDRGSVKYPSEFILESIVTLWKTLIAIESKDNLMVILMQGSSRNILVEVTLIFLEETDAIDKSSCISCGASILTIQKNIIFTYTNCLLANKVKYYNSAVASRAGVGKLRPAR